MIAFSFLPGKDLAGTLPLVCKEWYALTSLDSFWDSLCLSRWSRAEFDNGTRALYLLPSDSGWKKVYQRNALEDLYPFRSSDFEFFQEISLFPHSATAEVIPHPPSADEDEEGGKQNLNELSKEEDSEPPRKKNKTSHPSDHLTSRASSYCLVMDTASSA